MPAKQKLITEKGDARCILNRLGRSHGVAMIGNNQKIEWARKSCFRAFGSGHFFASCKPKGLFGVQAIAKTERVNTVVGVEVGIAPENLFWIFGIFDSAARSIRIIANIFTSRNC